MDDIEEVGWNPLGDDVGEDSLCVESTVRTSRREREERFQAEERPVTARLPILRTFKGDCRV